MKTIISATSHDYGAAVKNQIHLNALAYRGFLGRLGLDGKRLKEAIATVRAAIAMHAPDFILDELSLLATGADIPKDELIILNARSEMLSIWADWQSDECTSVAVTSPRSGDSVARIAQNWDWLTVMRDMPVIVQRKPSDGLSYVTFCEAGQLAKIGVNSAGLAVGLNFLAVPREEFEIAMGGLPVHLLIRVVLAEESITSAIRTLNLLPRGGAANLVLADVTGMACCVEIRPSRVDILQTGGITTHANDFEHGLPKALRSARLASILAPRVGRDDLFNALRDHGRAFEQICAHPTSPLASSTIASIVADCGPVPALWVALGTPCAMKKPECYRTDQ